MRVIHRISGQTGTLISKGLSYSSVKFDGDNKPSTVANDSIKELLA